jgi:cytoplasmic tRNA 2-thiolation protein 1
MAKLVPPEVSGGGHCRGQKVKLPTSDDAEEGAGGCGSTGRSSGGEMAEMEKKLQADEEASSREIEVTSNGAKGQNHERMETRPESRKTGTKPLGRKINKQTLGTCKSCGYMSSQEICKACTLLEGLNKNRPKMEIEVDADDEESSTLRRKMEGITLTGG